MEINDKNWYQKLFIDQAKPALKRHSGGSGNIVPLTVTADGVFEATDGVDGYSPVTVTALAEAEAQVGQILDIINGEVVGEDTGDK